MSLSKRLSVFFLAALAAVLVGYSAALYIFAKVYLERQIDERLAAALDTIEAGVDRDPDGLDWEPRELHGWFGKTTGPEAVRWQVTSNGMRVDASANLEGADFGLARQAEVDNSDRGLLTIDYDNKPIRAAWRRLQANGPLTVIPGRHRPRYPTLLLTAGLSPEPTQVVLQRLRAALVGLSLVVWIAAAVAGKWVCRKVLAPVRHMADAARTIGAADLSRRLPDPRTHDELGDLYHAFNDLLGRLEQSFERQRRFTGDASHQLRTPLTAMLGQVDVALRRERPAQDYREVLSLVQTQANNLRRIVEALLFLARADGDANLARLEYVDLEMRMPEYLGAWKQHPRAHDLHVRCEPAVVRVQPLLLGQLLDNLIDNALKYSAVNTPVNITVNAEGSEILLAVEDAGPGIPANELPHVFEPFFRSAEARRLGHAGVGLGLAMAQRIATTFGGILTAQSEVGHGSRFTFRLPACESLALQVDFPGYFSSTLRKHNDTASC